jgi:CubicO group peptidase (beta-lactamase class C family)
MNRRSFLLRTGQTALVTSLGFTSGFAKPHHQGTDFPFNEVEKLIQKIMKENNIPGISAAIIKDGKLAWNKAFGVKSTASKEPVDTETVFEAASVSKTVFAYAVMKLNEKAILKLDEPLTTYLPKPFLEGDPRLNKVTACLVLSHRAGFPNWRSPDEPLKIYFDPGTDFKYSGEGYFYLQSAITQLTGKTNSTACGDFEEGIKVCATDFGDYMVKNVLVPHGMTSSGYVWNEKLGENEAKPHDIEGQQLKKNHPTPIDMARYASAGGLTTTAKDFSKFLIGLFNPKENDPYKLNKKSLNEMFRPHVKLRDDQKIDGASAWALGWAVAERPNGNIVLHSGGHTGYRSLVMVSIERKSGFVMLTNSDKGGYVLYNEQLRAVLDGLFV